ncbi:MAG: outer membrane beta-barrel protein, partial [Terrimicrobiaceae bacterium]
VGWLMRYGTEASGINNVTQRQTFRTGLVVNHAFTRRLSANFSTNWLINYYDQQDVIPEFTENIVDFSLGLNFLVNRFVSLSAGYQYTIDIAPDAPEREYNRSVAFVGANFSF